jgi:hypothetical protein
MLFKIGAEISSYSLPDFILAKVKLKLNTLKSIYKNVVVFYDMVPTV